MCHLPNIYGLREDRGEDPQMKKPNALECGVPPTTTSQIGRDFELFQGHPVYRLLA